MLEETRLRQLHQFLADYSKEELVWVNGYLSGLLASGTHQRNVLQKPAQDKNNDHVKRISLVYGTETGNSKRVALNLATVAKKNGWQVRVTDLSQYRLEELAKEEYFFIVISTQGEGEPPLSAAAFYAYLHQEGLLLPRLKYSVLALGDSSYPLFCKTGEDIDRQFKLAGATRMVPIQKCDIDFDEEPLQWFQQIMDVFKRTGPGSIQGAAAKTVVHKKTEKKFYQGRILQNINLNDRGSSKQTYHIEIGSSEPIEYEPGDTIGIIPRNRHTVVDRIIDLSGIDEHEVIETTKKTASIRELLTLHLSICYLLTSTIKKYAVITGEEIPATRMDLVDLLRIYPVKNKEQFKAFVKVLLPIAPRLYSISSSPVAHGEMEVHITVAKNYFLEADEQRFGLCSEFLGDQLPGTALTFYVHKSRNFKLPSPEKDIIMIGPGTGIAPFRSFLAHRDATGANGRNWFFFGEQHFTSDFLYQSEIQAFQQTGVLTKIDLAFSRDQQEKIYVQHKMKEKAGELFQWIENGAALYISGTKDPMSKEVEMTLLEIIREKGNKTVEEASLYLEKLKEEGRFEKDVY